MQNQVKQVFRNSVKLGCNSKVANFTEDQSGTIIQFCIAKLKKRKKKGYRKMMLITWAVDSTFVIN